MDEWETLRKLLNGYSISRYGDGEIKHMDGRRNVSQVFVPSLQKSLIEAFHSRVKGHMVAIPNVFGDRVFTEVDDKYIESMRRRFGAIADPKYKYASAYISRGDLCPYLSQATYWGLMAELWKGRDVVLVRGHEERANPGMMRQARSITQISTPASGAWSEYKNIVKECLKHPRTSLFLLCIGPTATVLAWELAKTKRQALDIGHLGMFYSNLGIEDLTHRQVWNHRPSDPGYIKGVTDQ